MDRKNWSTHTRLNHPVEVKLLEGNKPLLQPVYHSSKFSPSEDFPYWDQYIYTRVSNPTTRQLELTLAELQNKEDCIVLSSGIAAITGTFLALLKSGDHIISFIESYKPSRVYIKEILPRYGIESTFLTLSDLSALEAHIKAKKTKLIHFESPTNPNLQIADINYIIDIARKHGVLVSMDGTFAGLHQHTQFDIDIMIHSLTKFGNGHGDVIAGSISGGKSLVKTIREMCIYLGATLDPQASYMIERGLKTYLLRYERQSRTAGQLAKYLEPHSKIKKVRYPGLESHENFELAQKQMKEMGAVIAFELDPSAGLSAQQFCHKLKLIQLTASIGSTESIICPTDIFFGLDLLPSDKEAVGINAYTVRLSVGLEDLDDLKNDLIGALN